MRYRELSPTGDYLFGAGGQNFLVDSPEMVAQSVLTRLRLWSGEWFLDVTEGTPWMTQILGENTKSLYDLAIQSRVLQTQGVTGIKDYSSSLENRVLTVTMTIDTQYGQPDPVKVVL